MDSKLVILITGSSTGFGRLFAETLSRRSHTVFATMRDPAGRNARNAAELRALAERESLPLHVLELDVTSDASVENAVRAVIDHSGRVDVAINNAGYGVFGLAEATTTEQARQIMDTNLLGPVRVNRAVLPHMRRQQSGLLLHISSGAGRLVLPGMAFYCASKFALEALAESYRYELASQGIDSVIIQPGAHQTAVFSNRVMAVDAARTNTYGAISQFASSLASALADSAGNAQDVADLLLRVIETPPGQRQLRYRISAASLGVEEINDLSARVQARVLETFGISRDTTFVQRPTATT